VRAEAKPSRDAGRAAGSGRRAAYVVPAAVFLVLALVAAALGFIVYRDQARDVRYRAGEELTAVRVLKASELAGWQADQLDDAGALADDPVLSETLERWIDAGQPYPAPFLVRSLVSTHQTMHEYSRIAVLDPSLHTVYSSPSGLPRLGAYTRRLAAEAVRTDKVVFSDFFVDGRGNLALQYVAPIRDASPSPDRTLGVYVLSVDPFETVLADLATWPTPGVSGETLLVERRGDEVLYLTPSRVEGGGALAVRRPADTPRLAGAMAVRGAIGVVDGVDYRGTPVLASVGPVPGTPWYLVARMDARAVSAQLRVSALATFAVVVGVILVGGLLLIFFWSWRESRQMRLLYAAERDLRASEEHFRVVFDDAPLGISLTHTDGRLGRVNKAFTEMLQYDSGDLAGLTVADLTHPDDRAETAQMIRACLAGERDGFTLDKRYLRKDGMTIWVTASVVLLRRDDGTPDHFVAMLKDVTERRADALRLARLTRLYRVLVAVNEALVRATRVDALYREVCEAIVSVGGFVGAWVAAPDEDGVLQPAAEAGPQHELRSRPYGIKLGDPVYGHAPAGEALSTGRLYVCGDLQHDAGTEPWHGWYVEFDMNTAAALPVMVHGEPLAAVVVFSRERDAFDAAELELFEQLAADVAFAVESLLGEEARAQAERDLARLNRELEQRVLERTAELRASNRELEAFSYSVSHDLRAPLRALDGFSLALLEDYDAALDDTGRDYLRRVRAASQRMGRLIDDLLTLSRVTRRELAREQVDLAAVAREVIAELREEEPGRRVEVTIPESLPTQGDPVLLRLVVQNLLANAWKFTSRREVAHVEVGVGITNGAAAYFVRDDGAGFDEAYADKLFAPFQRLHTSEEFPGTGVGLATAERIVRRHGGRMWAHGAVDSGATFFFTLR